MGFHERRRREHVSRRVLAVLGRNERTNRFRGSRAGKRGAGPEDRADREPVLGSAVHDLHGPQPRLRRLRARALRQCGAGFEAHEQDSRSERRAGVRARRAGCQLLRSVSSHSRSEAEALDRLPRPGLGQRDRQRARSRRRAHAAAVPRPLRRALRHGGRPRQRRSGAHRYGRAAGGQGVAALPVRRRPVGRRSVRAVEPGRSSRRWGSGCCRSPKRR